MQVTTRTIIGVSNCKFFIDKIHRTTPINQQIEYIRPTDSVRSTEIGKIGEMKHPRKLSSRDSLNAVILDVRVHSGKYCNVKIYENGKFHITGAKTVEQAEFAIIYIFRNIRRDTYEILPIMLPDNEIEQKRSAPVIPTEIKIYFKTVMKNVNFKIGFSIQRDKLSEYFRLHTDFTPSFESSINTGVTLKFKMKDDNEANTTTITLFPSNGFTGFFEDQEDNSKFDLNFGKKEKFHSFRVFRSGKVILSSRGKEMQEIYELFMGIVLGNRELFEEKEDQIS
jgi:hypothetical protein